jgi:small-conductance mechanosensitive channel
MSRNTIVNGRVGTALFMLLVFATMSLLALGFPEKARMMPLLVGIPGTLLALVQVVNEIRAVHKETGEGLSAAEKQMFGWTFLFFAGILLFGFVLAGPLLVYAFLLFGRGESLRVALISGVATWAVLYGMFEKGFEIPLFAGLLMERLGG